MAEVNCLLLAFALLSTFLSLTVQQPSEHPHKVLSPEQIAYQAAWKQWFAGLETLKAAARAPFDAEQARAKGRACAQAFSTFAQEQCLGRENEITESHEKNFLAGIRTLLNDPAPRFPGELPEVGPTGTPPTAAEAVAELNRMEAQWQLWRKGARTAAFQQGQGGTIAPILELEADQHLLRSHMQDLAVVYANLLADH